MKSILKDLKLESLIPKFAAERIELENVSELSDDELVRALKCATCFAKICP